MLLFLFMKLISITCVALIKPPVLASLTQFPLHLYQTLSLHTSYLHLYFCHIHIYTHTH